MRKILTIIAISIVSSFLFSQSPEELRRAREVLLVYKSLGEGVIPKYRNQIIPLLSPSEKAIENEIVYEVVPSANAQAVAYIKDGKK